MHENSHRRTLRHLPNGIVLAASFAGIMLAVTCIAAAAPEAPVGNWLTEDRDAVISIAPCGGALCGQITGIPLAIPGEPIPSDNHGRSQCHLTIIWDGMPDGANWKAWIIDPRNGSSYRILLQLDTKRRLRVRGYLGISLFGRTQVWTPFAAPLPADCRLPPRGL